MRGQRLATLLILLSALAQTACSACPLPLPELTRPPRQPGRLAGDARTVAEDYILLYTRDVVLVGSITAYATTSNWCRRRCGACPLAGVEVRLGVRQAEDQPLIDSLMNGTAWDEALARDPSAVSCTGVTRSTRDILRAA